MDKKTALYIRVSTDTQVEQGYSIDSQEEMLESYCKMKKISNYEFYIDGGYSGSNLNRPEIQRLLEEARKGKICRCVVFKLDRLSRSQKDTLYCIEDVFNEYGVEFVSLTENLDTSTPMGKLMIGILSAFAQLERENIRLRTTIGRRKRVEEGKFCGGDCVPFGYDYDKASGLLVVNQEQADIVRKVYDMYIQGYSPDYIAKLFDMCNDTLVRNILKRKLYYGVYVYNNKEYEDYAEPIIDKETFDLAQKEIANRSNKGFVCKHYLLTGLMYCGKCGAKMRYSKASNGGVYIYCYSRQRSKPNLIKDPNCTMPYIRPEAIESAVLEQLFLLKPIEKKTTAAKTKTNVLEELESQRNQLLTKQRKLYNLYAEGDEVLLDVINENKAKLSELDKRIDSEKATKSNTKHFEKYNASIMSLKDKWEYMSQEDKIDIVRTLIKRIDINEEDVVVTLNF